MPNYGRAYFEELSRDPGVNVMHHNTCQLLDFKLLVLAGGESHALTTADREIGIVVLTGKVNITVGDERFDNLGGRRTVFEGPPTMVYAPPGRAVTITALGNAEVALASSPSTTDIAPYRVGPGDCFQGSWGNFNTQRTYNYMINAHRPSERLHLAEVTVESGNWATYPPHKHDETQPERGEIFQEEMYYYRLDQAGGFGFCASYGGEADDDYAFMVRDNTIHKMPNGYHTVCAAPGYKVWYLALIAGHDKGHAVFVDPDHAWYNKTETVLGNVSRNLLRGGVK